MAKTLSIKWTEGLVMKTFGLKRVYDGFPLLDSWMTVQNDLTHTDLEALEYCRAQFAMDKGLNASDYNDLSRILLILRKFKHLLLTDLAPAL